MWRTRGLVQRLVPRSANSDRWLVSSVFPVVQQAPRARLATPRRSIACLARRGGLTKFISSRHCATQAAPQELTFAQSPQAAPQELTFAQSPQAAPQEVAFAQSPQAAPQEVPLAKSPQAAPQEVALAQSPEEAGVVLKDNAVRKLNSLEEHGEKSVLRLMVNSGGCSGYSYEFSLVAGQEDFFESAGEGPDVVVEIGGAKLVVDELSLSFLEDCEVDYVEEMIRSSFQVTKNKLADAKCGCGSSFSIQF